MYFTFYLIQLVTLLTFEYYAYTVSYLNFTFGENCKREILGVPFKVMHIIKINSKPKYINAYRYAIQSNGNQYCTY